jgi:hypothetical protein
VRHKVVDDAREGQLMTGKVQLRPVLVEDLPTLFEHQNDPEANQMAAFPARDREAFMAHWTRILADSTGVKMAILFEGQLAGNIVCWTHEANARSAIGSDETIGTEASPAEHSRLSCCKSKSDRFKPSLPNTTLPLVACSRSAASPSIPKKPTGSC